MNIIEEIIFKEKIKKKWKADEERIDVLEKIKIILIDINCEFLNDQLFSTVNIMLFKYQFCSFYSMMIDDSII